MKYCDNYEIPYTKRHRTAKIITLLELRYEKRNDCSSSDVIPAIQIADYLTHSKLQRSSSWHHNDWL